MEKFLCWDADASEEDADRVTAFDSESAAEEFVETKHGDMYWESGNGPVYVVVKSPDGKVEKFEVFIDYSPTCTATPVK